MKSVIAVVAGLALWTVLWLGGNQGLIAMKPEVASGVPITGTGVLAFLIVFSGVLSVLSGMLAGKLAPRSPVAHAGALAAVLFAIGVAVQASAWALFPVWYHVVFLGLIVPATLYGGTMAARRRMEHAAV
jgi:hypothetical protein